MASNDKVVLIILHGGLRNFLLASGVFEALRYSYDGLKIHLLTTERFADIANESGFFDKVIIDQMPKWFEFGKIIKFRKWFLANRFFTVIDLTNNQRTERYCFMMGRRRPQWCRSSDYCSHPFFPSSDNLKITDIYREQMAVSGFDVEIEETDISWLKHDNKHLQNILNEQNFDIENNNYFIICVDGSNKDRWNDYSFVDIIIWLKKQNIRTILVGTIEDINFAHKMITYCADDISQELMPINLVGKLYEGEIAHIARNAIIAIGGDCATSYICALAHCPTIILYNNITSLSRYVQDMPFVHSFYDKELDNIKFRHIRPVIDRIIIEYIGEIEAIADEDDLNEFSTKNETPEILENDS